MDRRTFFNGMLASGLAATSLMGQSNPQIDKPVHILGISCSPRKGKTTAQSIQVALDAAAATDTKIKISLLDLGNMKFSGWNETGKFEKDDFSEIVLPAIKESKPQAIIIGSPVYFRNLSSLAMAFLERLSAVRSPELLLSDTPVGVLSVGAYRNGGQELVIAQIQAAMLCHQAKIVGGQASAFQGATLWNNSNDDISQDTFGLESARKLGSRVARAAL